MPLAMNPYNANRYAPYVRQAAGALARMGARWGASKVANWADTFKFSRNKPGVRGAKTQGKRQGESSPVTFQHQYATMYRKGRVNKRRARRAKGKVKQYLRLYEKVHTEPEICIKKSNDVRTINAGQQNFFQVGLYTMAGTSNRFDDVSDIAEKMFLANQTIEGVGINLGQDASKNNYGGAARTDTKLVFSYAIMDIDIVAGASGVVLDIYEYKCRKTQVGNGNPETNFAAPAQTDYGTANGTAIATTTVDYTPFEAKGWINAHLILNKKRVGLSAGQTFSMQLKDTRTKFLNYGALVDTYGSTNFTSGGNVPEVKGWTRGIAIVAYGPLDVTAGTPAATTYAIQSVRRYSVRPAGLTKNSGTIL